MTRGSGCKPLLAVGLAAVMALSAGPAMAQHHRDHGRHGGPPPGRHYDRGYHGGGGYYGGYGRSDNTGAIIGGALLGLGLLGGAYALQQSQVAPPPAYYEPPPGYAPPPSYAPPPGYYGYK
ncbi:hypothetical protein [Roseococcus pinisoli]|uniref:Transmembrane protein n=1 Tax=Roseococcus pinisoli TaxID=2835040 RepID=A0ABS5Q9L5_9PROT|nr:hypothetical protein [Roseococcus pinisoli]MBS7809645.1 hypothetical protein [Roseococcus pinisoli]